MIGIKYVYISGDLCKLFSYTRVWRLYIYDHTYYWLCYYNISDSYHVSDSVDIA